MVGRLDNLAALGFLVLFSSSAMGQVVDSTSTDPLEQILESVDAEDVDADQLVQLLTSLLDNPLDVNTATRDELAVIPTIGPLLAQAIVVYRERAGGFESLPELQLVPGFSEDAFALARPFLTIGPDDPAAERRPSRFGAPPPLATIVGGLRLELIQRMTRRLDTGRGYDGDTTGTQYVGSPERLYTRLRARYGRQVSINLTAEKDPGEELRWAPDDNALGYDHVSGHFAIADFGRVRKLVAGDFIAAFGQGLVLWRGLSAGKGREVISPGVRSGNGIREYGSTEENRFFRGAAATLAVSPSVNVSLMASRRTLDATIEEGLESGDGRVVSSVGTTGLHRTTSELERRDQLGEDFAGGAIEWTGASHRIGAVAYRSTFDTPIRAGSASYQRFRFSGDEARVGSVFGSLFISDYVLFGELATDRGGAVAGTGGLAANLGRSVRAVVSVRHFPKDFTNLHAYAFGESAGSTQNESGVYTAVQVRPNTRWRLAGFFDQYRFPWVRFGVPRPSTGHEVLLLAEHKPRRWLNIYVQARSESKDAGTRLLTPSGTEVDAVRIETRQSIRGHLHYEFSRSLTTRTRFEGVRHSVEGASTSYGFLIFQDLQAIISGKLRLDARAMMFDTDNFEARVFAYEYDLRYTFSVPAFSGAGQRTYLMLTYSPLDALTLQAKYAVTRFEHVETVGSGLDETNGNKLRDFRVQLIWRP